MPGKAKSQGSAEFENYSRKYPNNSVILTSDNEELVIEMKSGKPVMQLSEYKEYLALNNDASLFASAKEKFGSIYKFRNIEAYSMVPEKGGFRKVEVKSFNKTIEASSGMFFDDIVDYNFIYPSVVRGSKMISRINMESDDPTFPRKFYFGDYFPGEEYNFTVKCPKNVEIKYRVYGNDTSIVKFTYEEKGGKKIYRWRASNPKSYKSDDLAPDADYYLPHLIVQVSSYNYKGITTQVNNSLDDFYKTLYKRISNINLSGSVEIKTLTDSLVNGIQTDREKVRKIYSWVQKNIKYIAFEDGENGFVPRQANVVIQRKYGDCKDKTSLLVAMMKSQGLNASYSWIGTRDIPYKFSEFPNGFDINHMVAIWWDENHNPVILDGTSHYNSLEETPAFIQGKECLIEKGPDNYKLYTIPVASAWKNIMYDSLSVELSGDTIVGCGSSIINGELRSNTLDYFEGKEVKELTGIPNKLMPKASNKFIVKSVIPVAMSDADSLLRFDYKFYLPDYLTINNNIAYLNLNLDRYPSGTILADDRWIPVELSSTRKHIFVCTFKIPEGYEIRDIPKNSSYENKRFGYQHSYTTGNRQIILKTIVTLDFQIIEGTEMAEFQQMLNQLNNSYTKTIPIYKTVTK